jgi:hypothetical protein
MHTTTLDRPLAFESEEETLPALTAQLLGLKAVHSEVDLIERLEKGLTIATVHSLQVRANLTDAETYQLIAPRRTLNREPKSALGDRTPLQLVATESGALGPPKKNRAKRCHACG